MQCVRWNKECLAEVHHPDFLKKKTNPKLPAWISRALLFCRMGGMSNFLRTGTSVSWSTPVLPNYQAAIMKGTTMGLEDASNLPSRGHSMYPTIYLNNHNGQTERLRREKQKLKGSPSLSQHFHHLLFFPQIQRQQSCVVVSALPTV